MSNNNNINLIVKANSNQKEFKEFLNQSISVEEVNNSEKPIWRLSNVIKPYRKSVTKDEEDNQLFSWGTYEDCSDENFETDGSTYIKINFSTTYGLPIPWMVMASLIYENLFFSIEFMRGIEDFSVTQIVQGRFIDISMFQKGLDKNMDLIDASRIKDSWFKLKEISQSNPLSQFQY